MKLQGGWHCTTLGANFIKCQNDTHTVQAQVFEKPSKHGINRGRISRLNVKRHSDKKQIADFDRGWEKKPKDYKKYLVPVMNYVKRRK